MQNVHLLGASLYLRLQYQLVLATGSFSRKQNFSPVQMSTLSKKMREHQAGSQSGGRNRLPEKSRL